MKSFFTPGKVRRDIDQALPPLTHREQRGANSESFPAAFSPSLPTSWVPWTSRCPRRVNSSRAKRPAWRPPATTTPRPTRARLSAARPGRHPWPQGPGPKDQSKWMTPCDKWLTARISCRSGMTAQRWTTARMKTSHWREPTAPTR